jgi:hypothetical protein
VRVGPGEAEGTHARPGAACPLGASRAAPR